MQTLTLSPRTQQSPATKPLANAIIQGNSLDTMRAMPAGCVDLIVTDPPFLVSYRDRDGRSIANDDSRDTRWLFDSSREMFRVLKNNAFCVSFCGWLETDAFYTAWKQAGFRVAGHFVWAKPSASRCPDRDLYRQPAASDPETRRAFPGLRRSRAETAGGINRHPTFQRESECGSSRDAGARYARPMTIEDLPMTDAWITRTYPHLSDSMGRVALLGEILEMARDLSDTRREISEAAQDNEKLEAIFSRRGTVAEIEKAEQVTAQSVVDLLAKLSEKDLQDGRDKGLISPEDYREALKAQRTMALSRSRAEERDQDRERE